eukprot:4857052-Pyramimonas_sp.AAC.1
MAVYRGHRCSCVVAVAVVYLVISCPLSLSVGASIVEEQGGGPSWNHSHNRTKWKYACEVY